MISGCRPDWLLLSVVFSSTLLIYGIHRIVGIKKLEQASSQGRFKIIITYKHHIQVYVVLSILALLYLMSRLDYQVIILLIPVSLISFLYTLPLLGSTRLRDMHLIKIFLIAFVWSYLGALPIYLSGARLGLVGWVFVEKYFFLLAITLPFDIRDMNIDGKLKTIPTVVGVQKTYFLAYTSLIISYSIFICCTSVLVDNREMYWIIAVSFAYMISALFIHMSRNKTSDYYYSGLLDSTLIIRGLAFTTLYCTGL